MEIKSVIARKPVSAGERLIGLWLIATLDMKKIQALTKPENDIPFVLQTIAQTDKAAKLLGFRNCNDMIEFTKMFGPESL